MLLVVVVGLVSTDVSQANETYFLNALVSVAIVVAIYVFAARRDLVRQISFVAVGALAQA